MAKAKRPPTEEQLRKRAIRATPEYQKLEQQRRQYEEKFYWSRHDPAPSEEARKQRTAAYEKGWNALRRKQSEMLGETWTDKRDRRDNFEFGTRPKGKDGVEKYGRGTIEDPDNTINWRKHTWYGRQRENWVRAQVSKGTGDHAGHLIPASAGADPEGVNAGQATRDGLHPTTRKPIERANYGRQNTRMNTGRGCKDVEEAMKDKARQSPDKSLRVEMTEVSKPSRFEGQRGYYRTHSAWDKDGKPAEATLKRSPERGGDQTVILDRYTGMNPTTPKVREIEARKARETSSQGGAANHSGKPIDTTRSATPGKAQPQTGIDFYQKEGLDARAGAKQAKSEATHKASARTASPTTPPSRADARPATRASAPAPSQGPKAPSASAKPSGVKGPSLR
jgi:hypothetical protein